MTRDHNPSPWTWRGFEPESDGSPLLYEPGNWGDVLKGSWALVALRSLVDESPGKPLRCLDLCAGQPTYPLAEASARRMERLGRGVFFEAQTTFRAQRRLASTGLLVRDACASLGVKYEVQVFDIAPGRLEKWESMEGVCTLRRSSGEEALASSDADFVLVDPYDVFDHWGRWLPPAVQAARSALVLIYLYNKSPRGRGCLDQYRRLRSQLRVAMGGDVEAVLGRVASDAVLPRAYHEVVLLGPPGRVQPPKSALKAETRALARVVAEDGAFEELRHEPG